MGKPRTWVDVIYLRLCFNLPYVSGNMMSINALLVDRRNLDLYCMVSDCTHLVEATEGEEGSVE